MLWQLLVSKTLLVYTRKTKILSTYFLHILLVSLTISLSKTLLAHGFDELSQHQDGALHVGGKSDQLSPIVRLCVNNTFW